MFEDAVEEIREAIQSMPPQQQKVGLYLCEHPDEIGVISLSDLAVKIGASGPTVNRFCRSLGYGGFLEFSRTMQCLKYRQISHAAYFRSSRMRNAKAQEDGALGRLMLASDCANVHKLQDKYPTEMLKQCADLMKRASSLAVIGKMSAYPAAVYFEQLLSKVTSKLLPMSGNDVLQAANISRMDKNSLVFALAFPRYPKFVVEMVKEASQRGVSVVAITDDELSPLAELSDLLFTVNVEIFSYIDLFGSVFALINAICLEFSLSQGALSEKNLGKYDRLVESTFLFPDRKNKQD